MRASAATAVAATPVAYHATESVTDNIHVTPCAACIKRAVSTADTASPSHIGTRICPSDDTAAAASYLCVRQATRSVVAKSVTVVTAGAANSWPSLDISPWTPGMSLRLNSHRGHRSRGDS